MPKFKVIMLWIAGLIVFQACNNHCELRPVVRYELSGGAGHYDYAPSFIEDEYGVIYGFLCENRDPFKIVDYVYLYKGIPTSDGIVWQPGTELIAPSERGWDSCHICDPDVRKFHTRYKGEEYDYIMTYLGVDQWDCKHNQIGLAVSKCIEGPWIKYEGNPLIPYEGRDKWGVGQSTTIVKDSVTVIIGYHSTTDNGPWCWREIRMDNLDEIVVGEEIKAPFIEAGNCYPMFSKDKVFIVTEEKSDAYDASKIPTWVGDVCVVRYKELNGGLVANAEDDWKELYTIGPSDSGFPRNHNPGFLTDEYGYMLADGKIVVFFTTAVIGEDWLWSYDLYSATFNLENCLK